MARSCGSSLLFFPLLISTLPVCAQTATPAPEAAPATVTLAGPPQQKAAPSPIPANSPHMSRETRLQIIRDFETQIVYARTAFPMGTKGLKLKNGVTSPSGPEMQQILALWGPAVKPGDPAHISYVRIKDDYIHFDINGGPVHRKKWYEKVQISGANGSTVPLSPSDSAQNPHGSYLDIYFDKYVPEMTAQQLREVISPVLDFNARNKEQAYLDTVPPICKQAIQEHRVLVGMNTEMVVHSKGKAPKKVREKDGDTDFEEWIYGDPPQDVDFVRIVGDEVVRIETMRVGGEKTVRTEKEVILERPDRDTEARQEQDERPATAPSLRRPGEDEQDVPKPPEDGNNPSRVPVPRTPSDPTAPKDGGPV